MLGEAAMTRYRVELELRAEVPAGYDFEAFLDRFYEHLLELETAPENTFVDPDLTAKLDQHTVDIEMDVIAGNALDVQICALTAVRTAIHVAGGATPGWESFIAEVTAETKAVELQDA
jgi:hypothetical protein